MAKQQMELNVLIVDFLDSYTYNLPGFLQEAAPRSWRVKSTVRSYKSLTKADVSSILDTYHGIVLSPGPGTVDCADDLGDFVPELLSCGATIPIYGVCLGFQAICKSFGGRIKRLSMPHHGLQSEILTLDGEALGRKATRYHSLEVELPQDSLQHLEIQAVARNFDDESQLCVMEVKHRSLPIWGVQYHPESIYSSNCAVTVEPFLQEARRRALRMGLKAKGRRSSLGSSADDDTFKKHAKAQVLWKSFDIEIDLLDLLQGQDECQNFILLDSSSKGEWDMLAFSKTASLFRYSVRNQSYEFRPLRTSKDYKDYVERQPAELNTIWSYLREFSTRTEYFDGPSKVPFWGGFIGYFSYELGLAQLGLEAYSESQSTSEFEDIQLLWSTENMIYDKKMKRLYLISLNHSESWIEAMSRHVLHLANHRPVHAVLQSEFYQIQHPSGDSYTYSIAAAQEEIKRGNSYELCLTAPSQLQPFNAFEKRKQQSKSFHRQYVLDIHRFRALRNSNPAAFMSHFNLSGTTFLSASPEEFLSFNNESRVACMKPIKGTLAKKDESGHEVGLADAVKALHVPKVLAENLMIVDLVRNDLSKLSNNVSCPTLLHVEELETMYQLVSTIEAEIEPEFDAWDLIKCCIPPGSMTGAPKYRSCQILKRLERHYRGLYSGIVGYVDVRGHCRTSVSIRNAVRYPGEIGWRIGAGGAITALSDPQEEWHERQLKANAVCQSFVPDFELLETILWDSKAQKLLYLNEHAERLFRASRIFGFRGPFQHSTRDADKDEKPRANRSQDDLSQDDDSSDSNSVGTSERSLDHPSMSYASQFRHWILHRMKPTQLETPQRISLMCSYEGRLSMVVTALGQEFSRPIKVRLDPSATQVHNFEAFVTNKTTNRSHYVSARERAEVKGLEEVLLFRPVQTPDEGASTASPQEDDVLTEGSYTNVAVWNDTIQTWDTPSDGCLPGIMRQRLLEAGEIRAARIERRELRLGMEIMLFNSVRGTFKGIIDG